MKSCSLAEEEAMKKLQKISNDRNERLVMVAKKIIEADELLF